MTNLACWNLLHVKGSLRCLVEEFQHLVLTSNVPRLPRRSEQILVTGTLEGTVPTSLHPTTAESGSTQIERLAVTQGERLAVKRECGVLQGATGSTPQLIKETWSGHPLEVSLENECALFEKLIRRTHNLLRSL